MLKLPNPYQLRQLTVADLTAVYEIDRLSFPTPARPGLFEHEINQNDIAYYQVLICGTARVGFAGYWLLGDEVHISSIAVHPEWRGRHWGDLLLLNMLLLAYTHPVNVVQLEVRPSNVIAEALYTNYQFSLTGKRRNYYRDTGEDAIMMSSPTLDAQYYQFLNGRQLALVGQLQIEDIRS